MIGKERTKYKTFCISDKAEQSTYDDLVNDTDIRIIEESRHWEGGECYVGVKYREEKRVESKEIETEKNNGLPSYQKSLPDEFNKHLPEN